ncbi:MAG: phosphoribosyl-ATP diphosphatase, partial [Planctomycetota bacterium]
MIVPSIDIQDGKAVQLRGGREKVLEAGDPRELMRQLRLAGEVAVIDLDAALGRGSNAALIRELCAMGRVRVGGGIRDVETALDWLDAGADKVILGTAARPEILGELPRERVIAALDAERGEVMVEGWRSPTGRRVEQAMAELAPYVGGFLVTWIENEGRLTGLEPERLAPLVQAAGGRSLTVAGGIAEPQEIAALDRLG